MTVILACGRTVVYLVFPKCVGHENRDRLCSDLCLTCCSWTLLFRVAGRVLHEQVLQGLLERSARSPGRWPVPHHQQHRRLHRPVARGLPRAATATRLVSPLEIKPSTGPPRRNPVASASEPYHPSDSPSTRPQRPRLRPAPIAPLHLPWPVHGSARVLLR